MFQTSIRASETLNELLTEVNELSLLGREGACFESCGVQSVFMQVSIFVPHMLGIINIPSMCGTCYIYFYSV